MGMEKKRLEQVAYEAFYGGDTPAEWHDLSAKVREQWKDVVIAVLHAATETPAPPTAKNDDEDNAIFE